MPACFLSLAEKQKQEKEECVASATKEEEEELTPTELIWSRTDVKRNLSGKVLPRKRWLYELDHGSINKNFRTYFSIADKMMRLPDKLPKRGKIEGIEQG